MTIYSTPLSDSQIQGCIHIRSARKQYAMWKRSKNTEHEALMWFQLLLAVSR